MVAISNEQVLKAFSMYGETIPSAALIRSNPNSAFFIIEMVASAANIVLKDADGNILFTGNQTLPVKNQPIRINGGFEATGTDLVTRLVEMPLLSKADNIGVHTMP